MTYLLGRHAMVVGAGISGLTTAKALSPYFSKVTVLERDAFPVTPVTRIGTPQARQIHVLLRGGLDALIEFFPEFETELDLAGAVRVRVGSQSLLEMPGFDPFPRRDLGFDYLCLTRPLVEFVARRLVEQQSNISVKPRCRVTQFLGSPDRSHVTGVRYDNAMGEASRLLPISSLTHRRVAPLLVELLDKLGLPTPQETEIGIDLRYATAMFRIPPSAPRDWRAVLHRPAAQSGRGGLLVPVENNCWQVNLTAMHGEPVPETFAISSLLPGRCGLRRSMTRSRMPYLSARFYQFAFPCSIRRHFEALDRFPDHLLPLGDAICRFNPAFGQGMSVAAQEAVALRRLIEARISEADPLKGLARPFFAAVQDLLAAPWATAESDFVHEKTRGRRPNDFQQRLNFDLALLRLAAEDAMVHQVMSEVSHLVKPSSALRHPQIVSRLAALLAASPSFRC